MELSSLSPGKKVVIKISRESTVAEFETEVIDVVGTCVVCKPVLHENKLVNFGIEGLQREVNIFDEELGRLFAWKQVDIKAGKFKKSILCHLLYLNSEPYEINRRNTFRQYLGIPGIAVPFHRDPVDVTIRDVSNTGIGILAADKATFEVGRHIEVRFSDENGRFRFQLECKIVRERKTDRGAYEFGCTLIEPPALFGQYVAYKQLATRRKALGLDNKR